MEIIPVIQANMGGRDYYLGKMTFQDLSTKVQFYSDLEESKGLEEMLQRQITKRSAEMTNYLLNQPERFYGAIIIASWGGNPSYKEVKMEDHPILQGTEFKYGVLVFDGKQEYFALDGQHRLKSIIEATSKDPQLRMEEITVIILPHEQTEEGNIKTRRLFHTLNRYAKPTTTGENISLDEDNVISITTRMCVRDIQLLNPEKLELEKSNITKAQNDKFSTLAAIYDFNKFLFDSLYVVDKTYLKFRPAANHVENVYSIFRFAWKILIETFDELDQIDKGLVLPETFRKADEKKHNVEEGNILLRPIGIQIYGQLVAHFISTSIDKKTPNDLISHSIVKDAIDQVSKLSTMLGQFPWKGTIFRNKKIERSGKALAVKLASYMLGSESIDAEQLLTEYQSYLEDFDAVLPNKVI